jgi:hypothetical protein
LKFIEKDRDLTNDFWIFLAENVRGVFDIKPIKIFEKSKSKLKEPIKIKI